MLCLHANSCCLTVHVRSAACVLDSCTYLICTQRPALETRQKGALCEMLAGRATLSTGRHPDHLAAGCVPTAGCHVSTD
jgi:hypothetical protein